MKKLTPYRQRVQKYTTSIGGIILAVIVVAILLSFAISLINASAAPQFARNVWTYPFLGLLPAIVLALGYAGGFASQPKAPHVQRRYNGVLFGILAVSVWSATSIIFNSNTVAIDPWKLSIYEEAFFAIPSLLAAVIVLVVAKLFSHYPKQSPLSFIPYSGLLAVSIICTLPFSWEVAFLAAVLPFTISYIALYRQRGYVLMDSVVAVAILLVAFSTSLWMPFIAQELYTIIPWIVFGYAVIAWLAYVGLLIRGGDTSPVRKKTGK